MKSPLRRLPSRALFALLLSACAAALFGESSKIDPRIFVGKTEEEPASFLVVLRDQADLSGAGAFRGRAERARFVFEALVASAERAQADLKRRLAAAGIPFRSFFLVDMIEVEAPRSVADEIAAREDVALLSPNPEIAIDLHPELEPPLQAPPSASRIFPFTVATVEPNVAKIGAPSVWSRGFTGQGIVVGMADTGLVWDHPALKPHYRGFNGVSVSHDYNWHDAVHDPLAGNACGASSPTPCDDDGHGTSTASLVVGDDGAGNQVGVAPGARFIGCRNMDRGAGTPARYTECFQFFLAPTDSNGMNPRPELGADVISNSWGCPASEGCTTPDVLRAVVENVRAAGVAVVVSAGNEGPTCSTVGIPATYDAAVAVGATTLDDGIAGFSSRGPVVADGSNRLKPDICAPGVGLRVATMPAGFRTGFSGTSGSAPEVAGAVALLWSAAPALLGQPQATLDLLRETAVRLTSAQDCDGYAGSAVPNAVFGWGRLDVAAAVAVAAPVQRASPARAPRRSTTPRVLPPRH